MFFTEPRHDNEQSIHTQYGVSQSNLLPLWQPRHGADIEAAFTRPVYASDYKNEHQWDVLNLTKGFESTAETLSSLSGPQHSWPPTLSSINMDMREDLLTKVGEYSRGSGNWLWNITTRKSCDALLWETWWNDLLCQSRSVALISLLMLSLLPGFVFGLLSPGNESDRLPQGDDSVESRNNFGILLLRFYTIVHMHP